MSRYIEVNKAKDIIWSHTRISADDYRLAVRMMFENSVEVDDADIHSRGTVAGLQRTAPEQLAEVGADKE